MVRPIKNKSIFKKLKEFTSSIYFLPFIMLFFVVLTVPVIYLVSLNQIDIRQRAATIVSGSVVIDTNESSFQKAAQEIVPITTINAMIGMLVVIAFLALSCAFVFYRKRGSS